MADPHAEAKKTLAEQRKLTEDQNKEAEARMAASTPTPTQHEADLAKLGVDVPVKQDHGSPEQVILPVEGPATKVEPAKADPEHRTMSAESGASYKTK